MILASVKMNLTQSKFEYKIQETDRASYPKSRFPDRPAVTKLFGAMTGDRDMSNLIPLTQGKFALVDDEDFDWLNQYKWHTSKDSHTFYAVRQCRSQKGKRTTIRMHREILRPPVGREIDHKDGNGLNNLRCNLRVATKAQNQQNRRTQKGTSRFKGVSWHRAAAKWQARIMREGKWFYLGVFLSEIEAAQTYDKAAKNLFGEFARSNF